MPVKDCLTPLGHNLQVETPDSNPRAVGEHSSCEVEKHVGPVVSTESLCYWCKYVNCLLKQEVLVSLRCTCHILLCFFFTVQACWSSLCGWRWHWPSCLHSETAGVSRRTLLIQGWDWTLTFGHPEEVLTHWAASQPCFPLLLLFVFAEGMYRQHELTQPWWRSKLLGKKEKVLQLLSLWIKNEPYFERLCG